MAFVCLGRPSVFVINFIIVAGTTLGIIMYILFFTKISTSLMIDLMVAIGSNKNDPTVWFIIFTSKIFYCVLLFIILLKFTLKKQVKELKLTSIILFVGVISLVVIFIVKVLFKNSLDHGSVDQTSAVYTKGSVIDSVSIIVSAYGFILNFFPVYVSIEGRNNKKALQSTSMALLFCLLIYVSFSYLAVETYGTNLNPNIFMNI